MDRPPGMEKRTKTIGISNVRSLNGKEIELDKRMDDFNISSLGITETKKKGQRIMEVGNKVLISSEVDQ